MTGIDPDLELMMLTIPADPSVESWAIRAGTVMMTLATLSEEVYADNHVELRKAIRELAVKMPTNLVVAAAMNVVAIRNEMNEGDG